jgi:Mg2+ and Co2+ transporter CorA
MNNKLMTGMLAVACTVVTFAKINHTDEEQDGKAKIHHQRIYTIADEAARILKDIEEQAYEVTDHAGTLHLASSIAPSRREFNASELEAVKEDVNAMGKEMQRLEALRQNEASWEQETVTRAMPLLKQVAATTDEAIRYVNDNPQKLALPEYQQIAKKLYDQSAVLWKTLHDSVKLANLHEREGRLTEDLQSTDRPAQ